MSGDDGGDVDGSGGGEAGTSGGEAVKGGEDEGGASRIPVMVFTVLQLLMTAPDISLTEPDHSPGRYGVRVRRLGLGLG